MAQNFKAQRKAWSQPTVQVARMSNALASTIGNLPTDGAMIISGGTYVDGLTAAS